MQNPYRFVLILLVTVMGCLIWSEGATVRSQRTAITKPAPLRQELTPEEKRGKTFYLRGETASGKEITARVNEIDVPATTLPCAGCHGSRGEGRTEGGVTAGNLTWSYLTKPYGHNEGGRNHPAFSEASFTRMLTAGLDPAGNRLSVAMPTYGMTQQDMADLIAYLKRIETDFDPRIFGKHDWHYLI